MRLIDADALLEIVRRDWSLFQGATYIGDQARRDELTNVIAEIINAPTIEAEPVRRGKWMYDGIDKWRCSVCGVGNNYAYKWDVSGEKLQDNYCPNCGARMDGESDE